MLRADGYDAVNLSVKGWLEEATRVGSGDDCTLGIMVRADALKKGAVENVKVENSLAPPVNPQASETTTLTHNATVSRQSYQPHQTQASTRRALKTTRLQLQRLRS
ncbi:MAG: hypothetical protein WKF84_05980 [Pyrinomonadaceae bacterium]